MKEFLAREQGLEAILDLNNSYVIIEKKDWREAVKIIENLPSNTYKISEGSIKDFNKAEKIYNVLLNNKEGIKHDSDKPRFDLLPADALEEVAKVYAVGAKEYGDRNWELGMRYGRLFRALMSHAWAFWRGEPKDKKNKLHHLTSVVFNALALLHYELNSEKFSKFDDRRNE